MLELFQTPTTPFIARIVRPRLYVQVVSSPEESSTIANA